MSSDFLEQLGVMALTFGLALVPALASRRMERSDHRTLVVIPIVTFFVAVLPGIFVWGFDKNSATYVLGAATVVILATLNYRFQPHRRAEREAESESAPGVAGAGAVTAATAAKEA